jgi:hypothetical protein
MQISELKTDVDVDGGNVGRGKEREEKEIGGFKKFVRSF